MCTILLVLISFPQFIEKEQQAKQDIKKCLDLLMLLQTANGNFPTKIVKLGTQERSEEDELVHWCHGAPGSNSIPFVIIIQPCHFLKPFL